MAGRVPRGYPVPRTACAIAYPISTAMIGVPK